MAAQVLPLLDDASQLIQTERLQNQSQYREQLLNLRAASLQNEQNLNPLRQQIMTTELQRNQQSIQQSAQTWAHQVNMFGSEESEAKSRAQEAQDSVTQEQAEAPYRQQSAQNTASRSGNEAQEAAFDNAHQAEQYITTQEQKQLQIKLGTSQLSKDAQDLAKDRSSYFMATLGLNPDERKIVLQPFVQNNTIDQDMYNQLLSAPDMSKSLGDRIESVLGTDQRVAYDQNGEIAKRNPTNTESILASQGKPTPQSQALAAQLKIVKSYMDMRDGKTNPKFQVGDTLGGSKVVDTLTNKKTGEQGYKLSSGKIVNWKGEELK